MLYSGRGFWNKMSKCFPSYSLKLYISRSIKESKSVKIIGIIVATEHAHEMLHLESKASQLWQWKINFSCWQILSWSCHDVSISCHTSTPSSRVTWPLPCSWHKYYLIIDMKTLNWGSSNVISHGSWIGKWFLVVQALSRKQYFFLDKNSCYAPTQEMFTLFIMTPQLSSASGQILGKYLEHIPGSC